MYSGIRRNHKNFRKSYVSSQEQEMLKKICKAKLELNEIINKKTKFLAQRLRWQELNMVTIRSIPSEPVKNK